MGFIVSKQFHYIKKLYLTEMLIYQSFYGDVYYGDSLRNHWLLYWAACHLQFY